MMKAIEKAYLLSCIEHFGRGGAKTMAEYKKILLAVDFSEVTGHTQAQALAVATQFGSALCLIHVVEPAPISDPIYGVAMPLDFDLTGQMVDSAKDQLTRIAESLGVPSERCWVEVGSPKVEIVRAANEQNVDLIVIGTHGRHGIGALLGSTASSVVHHASCDVLTVRLQDS
jgi:universal stress protein A